MATQPRTDPYRWGAFRDGAVPDGVTPHGWDENNEPIWVCRARFSGGVHPGMVRPASGGAIIAWGGRENLVSEYEVLMDAGEWVEASSGAMAPHVYSAGAEADGETLYVARGEWQGAMLAGKFRPAFGGANVANGDAEIVLYRYQVLVLPASAVPSPGRDRLVRGDSLGDGEVLTSPNGRAVLSHEERYGITWLTRDGARSLLTVTGMDESSKLVLTHEHGPRLVRPSGGSASWFYGEVDPRWPAAELVVQDDGDVVLLDEQGGVIWGAGTGFPPEQTFTDNAERSAYLQRLEEAGAWANVVEAEIFDFTLVRGVGPAAALQRIGAKPEDIGPMTVAEAEDDESDLRCIVAAAVGTSSILIEPWPKDYEQTIDDLKTLSQHGGEAVFYGIDIQAEPWFGYARDGVMIVGTEFLDVYHDDDGPFRALRDRLDRWDDGEASRRYDPFAELACLITEVQPTPADMAGPYLGVHIPLG